MRAMWAGLVLIGAMLTVDAPVRAQEIPRPVATITSAEAFAGEYGARLVDDITTVFGASVDRSCMAARGIVAPGRERVLEWLVRYGQRFIDGGVDAAAHEEAARARFIASSGAGAPAELQALEGHPLVREMMVLGHPVRLDIVADTIVEMIDRHLVLQRVRLARRLSPIATGAQELLLMREEREAAATQAIERHLEQHSAVPELQRFSELLVAWFAADRETDAGRIQLSVFDEFVAELRASCIGG